MVEQACCPFLAPFVWDCRWPLDLGSMQAAAEILPGTRDFSAMAAKVREAESAADPVKTLFSATWHREADLLIFRVHGTGFLHHMVRNLVGTLVEIGRGSLAVAAMESILSSCDRAKAGPTAPPQGLYLAEVLYEPWASQAPYVSALAPQHAGACP